MLRSIFNSCTTYVDRFCTGKNVDSEDDGTFNSASLRWYWLNSTRQGMGRNDFLYAYQVPPTAQQTEAQRGQPATTIQSEGKLTFEQYCALVEAVQNGTAYGESVAAPVTRSWAPYDPLNSMGQILHSKASYEGITGPAPHATAKGHVSFAADEIVE